LWTAILIGEMTKKKLTALKPPAAPWKEWAERSIKKCGYFLFSPINVQVALRKH